MREQNHADAIANKINERNTRDKTRRIEDAQKNQRDALILPIQQRVAEQFQKEVLDPRKDLWDQTIHILAHTAPTELRLNRQSHDAYTAEVTWRFSETIVGADHETELEIAIYPSLAVPIGDISTKDNPNELFTAVAGLSPEKNTVKPSKLHVGESLLNVPVINERGKKTVKNGELRRGVAEQLTPKLDQLYVNVTATQLGLEEKDRLFTIELKKDDFKPIGTRDSDRFLTGDYSIVFGGMRENAVIGGVPDEPNPTYIETFLEKEYIKPGIGQRYTDLASTLPHLDNALPLLEGDDDVVLEQKPKIVRKLMGWN